MVARTPSRGYCRSPWATFAIVLSLCMQLAGHSQVTTAQVQVKDDVNSAPWAPQQTGAIFPAPANPLSVSPAPSAAELPAPPQSESATPCNQLLTLPEAIALAYRTQPKLK